MNGLTEMRMRSLSVLIIILFAATIGIHGIGQPQISTALVTTSNSTSQIEEDGGIHQPTTITGDHLLLDSIDLLSFGNINVDRMIPVSPLSPSTSTLTLPIPLWNEAFATTFIVHSQTVIPETALINSGSYEFSSVLSATAMLDIYPKDSSLIDSDAIQDLNNREVEWRAWYSPDDDGLPAYTFLFQNGLYVIHVTITSAFEQGSFGQQLLSHAAIKLIGKSTGHNSRWKAYLPLINLQYPVLTTSTNTPLVPYVQSPNTERRGQWWEVEFQGLMPHFLVVWQDPNGGQPAHYYGLFGDEGTCVPVHGCIGEWNFYNTSNRTKMGVPKTFIFLEDQDDIHTLFPGSYAATFSDTNPPPTPTAQPNNPSPTLTPPPGSIPTPTPPPTSQGITVLSAWPQGIMGIAGQEVRPEVVVQTSGFNLNCGQEYLENRDGNLYGAHPIQGCIALGNNKYKISFGTPMRLPETPGEYHSRWQIWKYPNHVGPQIDLWFRVAQEPDHGQPPSTPTLRSPGDLHTERTGLAPELCWNPSTDPDGEPVKYFVEVRGGRIDDSGWITQTCWRPTRLDGPEYYGYEWRVKAQDPRGIESGWSSKWRFGIQPAPFDPPIPTSTPPAGTPPPTTSGEWWNAAWNFRRPLPIATTTSLGAGHIIKVDGFDLETLVIQGKARPDHNDIRIMRRGPGNTWQEVPRNYYSGWDLEFRLLDALPTGTDTSYYLYYGNPNASAPPTYGLPQGWWVDMYVDSGLSSFHSTHPFNIPMDFNRDGVCYPPLDHFGKTGQRYEESDKFRSRLWIPTTGDWRFTFYHNDQHEMYLDGRLLVSDTGFHSVDADATSEYYTLKAGWHTMELRHMWVNCGSWRFSMEGPGFPRQVVPAAYFQQVWGNIKEEHTPSSEETAPGQPTPTPTPIPPTATAIPTFSYFGDGRDGDMPASGDLNNNNGFGLGSVKGTAGATSMMIYDRHSIWRIKAGDYILIHQTRGAGAGKWELNRATVDFAGNGTTVSVERPLHNSYDTSINGYQNQAQVVRVPQYRDCPVSGTVTPLESWNGIVGGIFAVMCQNQATISGAIDLSGRGFRGGASGNTYQTDQWQGESILSPSGYTDHYYQTTNRTPSAQGGGAANNIGGGGGGAGYSPGSDGDHVGGSDHGWGGIGHGTPNLSQIFFGGGGGGAATVINPAGGYATSGNGAGIVFLFARTITITGQVRANGQTASGVQTDDNGNRRVTGGSGGGGQIYIKTENISIGANGMSAVGGPRLAPGGPAPFGGGAGGNGYIYIEHCGTVTGTGNTAPIAVTQSASCTP